MLLRERWKTIPEHPSYQVSSMGKVINSQTGVLLNPYDDGRGYLRVKLDGRCCRLHILVAEAFVINPDPENKTVVNHKKGKKHDCRASKLEWVTQQENVQHAWNTGLIKRKGKKKQNGL